jgi:hypothetical protein
MREFEIMRSPAKGTLFRDDEMIALARACGNAAKLDQTHDKQPIAYPKTDKPEIISVIGIIEPGGRTPLHEHPVPIYVYILEGEWNCRVMGDSRINTKPARHTSRLSITSKSRSSAARRRGRSPDGDARTAVSQVEGRS